LLWKNRTSVAGRSKLVQEFCCSVHASSNVLKMRWLPQASLLAHPKTRLFISHCGLNAVFEAAHYGVPVLAIPLSADQHNHAAKVYIHSLSLYLCQSVINYTSSAAFRSTESNSTFALKPLSTFISKFPFKSFFCQKIYHVNSLLLK